MSETIETQFKEFFSLFESFTFHRSVITYSQVLRAENAQEIGSQKSDFLKLWPAKFMTVFTPTQKKFLLTSAGTNVMIWEIFIIKNGDKNGHFGLKMQ
jgi:hypothetical protein